MTERRWKMGGSWDGEDHGPPPDGLTINRFYHEDGYTCLPDTINGPAGYYDDEGMYWGETPVEYILQKVFGFCGCGMPEQAARYIFGGLREIQRCDVWRREKGYEREEWIWLRPDGERYFFWYVLYKQGLTEHGGSVPGWLTEFGTDVLADLEIIVASFEP